MKTILLLTLAGGTLFAQNSDLGLLLGFSNGSGRVSTVTGEELTARYGAGGQINLAFQLRETKAGRFYLELPVLLRAAVSGSIVNGVVSGSSRGTFFFTPGVRWNIPLHARVSLYAAAGAGLAVFEESVGFVGKGVVSGSNGWTPSPAAAFGGGVDFRLTKLLSLRAETRDFLSDPGLGGKSGINHLVFGLGVGFHW